MKRLSKAAVEMLKDELGFGINELEKMSYDELNTLYTAAGDLEIHYAARSDEESQCKAGISADIVDFLYEY